MKVEGTGEGEKERERLHKQGDTKREAGRNGQTDRRTKKKRQTKTTKVQD